jgi:peptidoglycan/LPS O-acetylase OafA/YrhL
MSARRITFGLVAAVVVVAGAWGVVNNVGLEGLLVWPALAAVDCLILSILQFLRKAPRADWRAILGSAMICDVLLHVIMVIVGDYAQLKPWLPFTVAWAGVVFWVISMVAAWAWNRDFLRISRRN